MRKTIYLILIFILCNLPLFAEVKNDAAGTWDFGKVKEGEVVKHEFVLKNESKDKLNIQGVSTSCGCTASAVKNKSLKAGDSTVIDVSFNSAKYSGAVKQFVYVNTDNVKDPLIIFEIRADVVKDK
ncbi:MAG: DUF1573 domain-containing protein [Candidatus Omnitrophica bacterium]|nr:DUF1573 domain-containing protein [Candidatus Omnitrophota bacterium]